MAFVPKKKKNALPEETHRIVHRLIKAVKYLKLDAGTFRKDAESAEGTIGALSAEAEHLIDDLDSVLKDVRKLKTAAENKIYCAVEVPTLQLRHPKVGCERCKEFAGVYPHCPYCKSNVHDINECTPEAVATFNLTPVTYWQDKGITFCQGRYDEHTVYAVVRENEETSWFIYEAEPICLVGPIGVLGYERNPMMDQHFKDILEYRISTLCLETLIPGKG